jgi:hypothetical protein
MTERCGCCGEGKDPANPNGLDWETLCAQPTWQCNDCEQWNGVKFMHELRRAAEGKAKIFGEYDV